MVFLILVLKFNGSIPLQNISKNFDGCVKIAHTFQLTWIRKISKSSIVLENIPIVWGYRVIFGHSQNSKGKGIPFYRH